MFEDELSQSINKSSAFRSYDADGSGNHCGVAGSEDVEINVVTDEESDTCSKCVGPEEDFASLTDILGPADPEYEPIPDDLVQIISRFATLVYNLAKQI